MKNPTQASLNPVRNGSESAVPNHSELKMGRPVLCSDGALLDIARRQLVQLGRPPRADELITESGGCQRSRALNIIRTLKLDLAKGAVKTDLVFPQEIESSLRQLMGRWQELAATQLAQRHQEMTEQFESRELAQRSMIDDQEANAAELVDQLRLRDARINRLTEKLDRIEAEYATLKDQHIEIRTMAAERLRLIRQWKRDSQSPEKQS